MSSPEVIFDAKLGGKDKHGTRYRDPKTGWFVKDPTKPKEITFKCKFCGNEKPLDEIRSLIRFFPPLIACLECERRIG